ncbi:hypothetical protein ACEXQE_07085 [Herbiconiux sp. P17]|uniref:hypothetical protein n=1 Tax=Herbiconiux wuyangfengii TaxID=3342794 RepID=UPI0035B92EB0
MMHAVSELVQAAGDGQFLGVDWGAFMVVFLVAFAATIAVVVAYSLGLRLLAVAGERHRPVPTGAAWLCFAIAGGAVLYGLWLIIPQFH